jgi:hypothetical protein
VSSILSAFLKSEPDLDWFIFNSCLPWIRLNIEIPFDKMYGEAKTLLPDFIEYRETNSKGWKSICIHGISSSHIYDYTYYEEYKNIDQNTVPYRWTEISKKCPVTTKFLKNNFFNAKFFRVRYMALEPGGYILPHTDMPKKILAPINISLNNPDNCIFKMKNYGIVPFKAGNAFILDTSNEHVVYNNSNETRIHMIVHINYPILSKINQKKWAKLLFNSWRITNQHKS